MTMAMPMSEPVLCGGPPDDAVGPVAPVREIEVPVMAVAAEPVM
jgi:hypothetical protein